MSVAVVGTASVAGFGALAIPLLLAVGVAVTISKISSINDEKRERQYLDELRENLSLIDNVITQEMTALIDGVSDVNERKLLQSQLQATSSKLKSDIVSFRNVKPDEAFREFRRKVLSVQMDEKLVRSLNDEFSALESALDGKIPPGFAPEWDDIKSELKKVKSLALQKKIKSLTALLNRTKYFAKRAARVANMSDTELAEEKFSIPDITSFKKEEKREDYSSIIQDIVDFGTRVAYFDESEARKLRPLMDEAASEKTRDDKFRLTAIRQEIKMRYGKLKESKVLTETFKQEIRDMLPLVKRARGAESLIFRMEELLIAREIPRGDYMSLYKDIKALIAEQLESMTDELAAEKIGKVLNEMGYSLVDGDIEDFSAREVNYIESPYEGYQVKIKVDKGGTLSTRLVRVAGSEEEKNSQGEYQRQKDIEIGRKWCKDLEKFHEKMKSEGFDFKTAFRKEPEEQPLDVVVKSGAAGKKKRAQRTADQLKEKRK